MEIRASLSETSPEDSPEEASSRACDGREWPRQGRQLLSSSLPAWGYLRSGRLYPLGVVHTSPLRPEECLGIVASCGTRSRSSTELLARQQEQRERRGQAQTRNRRSSSAVVHNSGTVRHHSRSVTLPANTALVPRVSLADPVCEEQERRQRSLSPREQHSALLPPVTSTPSQEAHQGEIKIEVRTIVKSDPTVSRTAAINSESSGEEPQRTSKLPSLTPHPTPQQDSSARCKGLETREIVKQVSIISLGATDSPTRPARVRGTHSQRRKKLWSTDKKDARLSLGWSPPQSLEPITGHPVVCLEGREKNCQERGEKKTLESRSEAGEMRQKTGDLGTAGEAAISRDYIHIDVQEYLANDSGNLAQ